MRCLMLVAVLLLGVVSAIDCIVDDLADQASLAYGRTTFTTIQEAIATDWCTSIFIRFTDASAYFENIIIINQSSVRTTTN